MKFQHTENRNGYSLIEMLIVLSIISLIIPVVFSILYVLLTMQVKVYRMIETKRQGDRIMSFMKEKITREALGIRNGAGNPRCTTYLGTPEITSNGNNFIFIKDRTATPATFNFYVNNNNLFTRDSVTMTNTTLHDAKISVTNFQIECFKRNPLANPFQINQDVILVGFSYTVSFIDNTPTPSEGSTTLQYHAKVRLR